MAGRFLDTDKAMLTVMVQADTPDRVKELMDKAMPEGAEAFGIQLEQMQLCYQTKEVYKDLFSHTGDKMSYVTNYRVAFNKEKTDEKLAEEIVTAAGCGADLCDVMGDYFDPQPGEMTYDEAAVEKQKKLIDALHAKGAKVLMSSHVLKYIPAEEVLKIALAQQERGADVCKIVTGAATMEEQLENLKIIHMLKQNLKIPFLFLTGGTCQLLRRIGGEVGNCMYLCVYERDAFSTPQQPLLKNVKALRENMQPDV